ncbi:MAG: glycosyltransferase involved in cell wall biosynthesis [Planctomycetota bacterium]|jgi:glycosyltransferase involved in cell wall biosynthesis
MRILLVSHLYPPANTAGTEVYTESLARSLLARGYQVHVFCTVKDVGRADLQVERREQDGVTVHELVQNLFHDRFEEQWSHPAIEARFQQLLSEVQPDVVHVQHLMYLSAALPQLAREAGARVLATLHDFGLECGRFGQLVDAQGELCAVVDAERCGRCLASLPWRQSDLQRRVGRGLAKVRHWTGVNLAPLATKLGRRGAPGKDAAGTQPATELVQTRAAQSLVRREVMLAAYSQAALVFSPSRFLAERAIAAGLDAERVQVLPTGVARGRVSLRSKRPRTKNDPLRVLFLGSYVPLKGAHVLVEAWTLLDGQARDAARLVLHGPGADGSAYASDLQRRAKAAGLELGARLEREQVQRALGHADVVVVPSLWYENRPLVILEALQAGAAVIASDLGALPELVTEQHGWRFPAGDAAALAQLLASLIQDPAQVDGRHESADLPDWEATVDRIEAAYRAPQARPE